MESLPFMRGEKILKGFTQEWEHRGKINWEKEVDRLLIQSSRALSIAQFELKIKVQT